ncbi:MAG: glycerol kinase GlpK [Chloroflexi bacterium]|nr:glycerol kinase GlpK [Chloroflexota bacterium]MBM3174983.1 glycerol kinase GlpK [Chloroflexota bacterium]MBM4449761.1 glycerol kinase GlpK [Chloroflexota bacterium]
MVDENHILAIDQGTTGSTAILFNKEGRVVSTAYQEIRQIYPQPGWVEHDPKEIYSKSLSVTKEAIQKARLDLTQIKGIGITNQRETTIVWERHTGEPVSNAIVWQCRRTAAMCEELKQKGYGPLVRDKTGLVIDAYFSATKLRWILDHIPNGQKRAESGELLFGTVDTWLAWNLTGGRAHVTDYSNASRTMLFNIHTLEWDRDLLAVFDIPQATLPRAMPSSCIYGETPLGLLGDQCIPIAAIAGDQQSALFGQACYEPGMAKNTYGTGSFILLNTDGRPVTSQKGLLTTVAWGLDNKVSYAMEGSVFITGAAIQWLRDGLAIISNAAESETLAHAVQDTGGVYFVPAFVGLGAPYWDMYARGTIVGITRGTTRGHVARATLEAIAYQVRDVVEAMCSEANLNIPMLRVDGGGTANALLMQFQADILGVPIQRAAIAETTALGAAYLAGLAVDVWQNTTQIAKQWHASETYEPKMPADQKEKLYADWKRAVERARSWVES